MLIKNMSNQSSLCPVCDASVTLPQNPEESEIVSCPDCQSSLVIDSLAAGVATLSQAPEVEEDWGE